MAKASIQYKQVVQPIEKVTLEMSQDEVMTLLAVLARVAGCSATSPRKHADKIYSALHDVVNLDYFTLKQTKEFKSLCASDDKGFHNTIMFEEYKEVN